MHGRTLASTHARTSGTGIHQPQRLIVSLDITKVLEALLAPRNNRIEKAQTTNFRNSIINRIKQNTYTAITEADSQRIDTDWSDSGTSDDGDTFFTRLNQRSEKHRSRISDDKTSVNFITKSPKTDCEIGSSSTPDNRLENLSDFEHVYSFLSEDERHTVSKEANRESQRKKKRALRIARSSIIRVCSKCSEHRQMGSNRVCHKHLQMSQFLKVSNRGLKTRLETHPPCKRPRQIHPQQ